MSWQLSQYDGARRPAEFAARTTRSVKEGYTYSQVTVRLQFVCGAHNTRDRARGWEASARVAQHRISAQTASILVRLAAERFLQEAKCNLSVTSV